MSQDINEKVKLKLFDHIEKCILGCVAAHDINTSLLGFEKLISRFESTKHDEKSMIFRSSVIAYCKPFLEFTASKDGRKRRYPDRKLRKSEHFDQKIHEHLIEIRNKIIAHSDWTELKPEFIMLSFRPDELDWEIPIRISVTSQAVTYPNSIEFVRALRSHAAASLQLIRETLELDLKQLRYFYVESPELCRSFLIDLANFDADVKENVLKIPKIDDALSKIEQPDYSNVHNGYYYEALTMTFEYASEETFVLPNGEEVTITPETSIDESTG